MEIYWFLICVANVTNTFWSNYGETSIQIANDADNEISNKKPLNVSNLNKYRFAVVSDGVGRRGIRQRRRHGSIQPGLLKIRK